MVIWEYVLEITDTQVLEMPKGAEILSVANQRGKLCLWAACDPDKVPEQRTIEIVGTGNSAIFCRRKFIGTVLQVPFVWHIFERFA